MPLLEHDKAIKQYWEEVKDQYPYLEFDRFSKICRTPFEFIKQCIRRPDMPVIMIKFFGRFKVFPGRIKTAIIKLKVAHQRGDITTEDYLPKLKRLEDYLNELNNSDDKEIEITDE